MPSTTRTTCTFPSPAGTFAGGTGGVLSAVAGGIFLLFVLLLAPVAASAATPPGTPITNTAFAEYRFLTYGTRQVASNPHTLIARAQPTPASAELYRYQPGNPLAEHFSVAPTFYSTSGTLTGPFTPLTAPTPLPGTTPLNLNAPLDLVASRNFIAGDPVFITLTDLDQNLFSDRLDTIVITVTTSIGDREVLQLTETAPASGVFSGYLPTRRTASAPGDGALFVEENTTLTATYRDSDDAADTFTLQALFDPQGRVFNSATGEPIDGATITIIDMATGQPAEVYGDDGISRFPATIVSGGTVSDSSGAVYQFGTGGFRFPLMKVGTYRLEITPPGGYAAPSHAVAADLQQLPGAPWTILEDASRGEAFILNPVPILHFDIPLDPIPQMLWVEKRADKEVVGVGEFVPYAVTVTNTSDLAPAIRVSLTDQLPPGFRYQPGSSRIDDVPTVDPAISADGRTLTYALQDIAPGQKIHIHYVAAVGAGARSGKAVNLAFALSSRGTRSNTARAEIKVRDDFMREKVLLAGRVMNGDCNQQDTELTGAKGIQIYLEDGSYVVTDDNGLYHFEGVRPGTHVAQIDQDTIPAGYEAALCADTTAFAETAASQFVDVRPGTLWRADFYLKKTTAPPSDVLYSSDTGGSIRFGLKSELRDDSLVVLTIPLEVTKAVAENTRVSIILPPGGEYQTGSSQLARATIDDPENMAVVLTYRLGDLTSGSAGPLTLAVRLTDALKGDEIPFRAMLTVDNGQEKNLKTPLLLNTLKRTVDRRYLKLPEMTLHPQFPPLGAELSVQDGRKIDDLATKLRNFSILQVEVAGHTDNLPIPDRSLFRFASNEDLALARARNVAGYLQQRLTIPKGALRIYSLGDSVPVADNATEAGRARNRRVDLRLVCEKSEETFTVAPVSTDATADPLPLTPPQPETIVTSSPDAAATSPHHALQSKIFGAAALDDLTPGYAWLWPPVDYHPSIPSLKVAVRHDPADRVQLILNGKAVDPLNFDGTRRNAARTVALSRWNGIDIVDGDNVLKVQIVDQNGAVNQEEERVIHYSLPPVTAEIVPDKSTLIANSAAPAIVAVLLLDREGHPAREGVVGEFRVDPPYAADNMHFANPELGAQNRQGEKSRFVVGENGIALISLSPTNRSGEVKISFALADGSQEIAAWLNPKLRDWILVGVGEGTAGYNVVSGNMESLAASDTRDDFYSDGRLAFFAKGKIRGSWLLTMAYDSDKPREDSLQQTIDSDTYYTVYGDGSQQQYDAPSQYKLYVKLERDQFYALFGDYDTGLTVTELARYSRSLSGFKTELQSRFLTWNFFAAQTSQGFIKDEIPGDGTSGLYRLSSRDLVLNSEKIVIETRDRFDNSRILSSRNLARHIDYNIDYDLGTLFFKEPVPTRDENFNPVFIVVDYETTASADRHMNYGGRVALRLFDQRLELGTSIIHEGNTGIEGDLYGADATVKITGQTTLRVEGAQSSVDTATEESWSNAWLAEIRHQGEMLSNRTYIKEQQSGFGLGQQRQVDDGMRRIGTEAEARFTDKLSLQAEASRELNLETDARKDVAEAAVSWQEKICNLKLGLRQSDEVHDDRGTVRSLQGIFASNWQLTPKLTLRLNHDQTLDGNDAATGYPTRTLLGADYKITEKVALYADQEWASGDNEENSSSRAGIKSNLWEGAQASTGIEQKIDEEGTRTTANMGLKQRWQATSRLSLDAGLDRSQTLHRPGYSQINPEAAPVSGSSSDYTAVSAGATWKEELWSWENRIEFRTAGNEEKWNLLSSAIGEPRRGLALSGRALVTLTDTAAGAASNESDIRLGAAWRALESRWIFLDRLDYAFENRKGELDYSNWRIINNLHANVKPSRKTQLSLQYGLKYVREQIADASYSGYTDIIGGEGRYDLTPRWDCGLHGNVLHSWESGQFAYRSGASVGYKIMKNAWLSVGYNLTGFRDEDFSGTDYTTEGPFIRFRFKFDQNSVKEILSTF